MNDTFSKPAPLIAIHQRDGSFSDRWIQLCNERNISFQLVDCYRSDIITQISDSKILLWHWHANIPTDRLIARSIIHAAELKGLVVFPDTSTCWSYDDKISQKYQLEAIGAPLVSTYMFYNSKSVTEWLSANPFPHVFKLRCGAGSTNVRLIKSMISANKLVHTAFSKGFRFLPGMLSETLDQYKKSLGNKAITTFSLSKLTDVGGVFQRIIKRIRHFHARNRQMGRESGYLLFQEYIPANLFDTRITIIGDTAFGFTRMMRKNDWRASGSGNIYYDITKIDLRCVQIAFDTAAKLKVQSIAFDFLFSAANDPQIIEISYCYNSKAVYNCPGHWNRQLQWIPGHVWPQDLIFNLVLQQACLTPPYSS